ncbi:hypothetical protein [Francisella marina]|uniref:Uncharacterized protein n=1 Tax=Francisella marina TaxID=2249302 RepID=A0ABX5ZJM4_9GAMM|nr:hypothetical protein [Francisella marina]QEO58227.1 hypothetical protein F0R74_10030 [Francisella marina]QEO60168.1 hypothetical protein F0R75_10080 [Francisella marina]
MFLEEYWEAIKNPTNAIQGMGNRNLALIYYAIYTGMKAVTSDEALQEEMKRSASKIRNLLSYSLKSPNFSKLLKLYETKYPGFKGGWNSSKIINNEIIFRKGKLSKNDLNYFQKQGVKQSINIGTEPHAIFGALLRAEINGKLSNNSEIAKYQIAYIIVTGESNLYNFVRYDVSANSKLDGSNWHPILQTTKNLAYLKS